MLMQYLRAKLFFCVYGLLILYLETLYLPACSQLGRLGKIE